MSLRLRSYFYVIKGRFKIRTECATRRARSESEVRVNFSCKETE
jgi:hypothetical protein